MGDWAWVAAGYALVYGTLVGYAGWLAARLRRAQRDLGDGGGQ